jgi:regulatory protein
VSCYDKALDLLARRAHFSAELEAKLSRRGFSSEQVAETLERLAAGRYLDDLETARGFVAERRGRNGWGRARLEAELLRRGASAAAADAALAGLEEEDEWELARQVAERWSRRRGGGPEALARHLQRKGFASRVILRLVREIPDQG